ncbi:hypothetical protein, partial [Mycobacterium tuberculosis]|uniref:hypothetical protein n=1 Tax=Mycobacterium tuberculosis TaxID=1773 RepID=UPI001BE0BC38
ILTEKRIHGVFVCVVTFLFLQAEDVTPVFSLSRGTTDMYKRQRLLSAQSAETRTSQRAMAGILSHSSVTSVVNWLGGTGSVTA